MQILPFVIDTFRDNRVELAKKHQEILEKTYCFK